MAIVAKWEALTMTIDAERSHVLVVDNAPGILNVMRELLQDEGLRVTSRARPLPELDEIMRLEPNLIILDYLKPGETRGWSLLRALKRDRRTRAIPVLLCTAAKREVEAHGPQLAALGVHVVLKPFDIEVLLAVVAGELGARSGCGRAPPPDPHPALERGRLLIAE